METIEKTKGFSRGLDVVYNTKTAAEYDRCRNELRDVIMTTEKGVITMAIFYNKRDGRTPLTLAEEQRIAEVFAEYGITDWQGVANQNDNDNQNKNEK